MQRAALLYGEPRNSMNAVREIHQMIQDAHFSSMRGEPPWLLSIREVAEGALDEYYGNHGKEI